jgi:DNA-directed RNA polymerase subunit L
MEVKILNEDKHSIDLELSSLTIAEVLRVYLNKGGAKLAVWKRNHPTERPVLHIEGDDPKKLLKNSIEKIGKELDTAVEEFKKLK